MDIKEEKRLDNLIKKQREIVFILQDLNSALCKIEEFRKRKFTFEGDLEDFDNIFNCFQIVKDTFKFFKVDSFYKIMEEAMKQSQEFVKKTNYVTDDWYRYEIDNLREETQRYYDWIEKWMNENENINWE